MDEITLDNKKYVSTKRAAELSGYANDYVGQLCRAGKINATRIGRSWYVEEQSLLNHKKGPVEKEVSEEETKEEVVNESTPQTIESKLSVEKADEGNPIPINRTTPLVQRFEYEDKTIAAYETDSEAPLLPPLRAKQEPAALDLATHIQSREEDVTDVTPSIFRKKAPKVASVSRLSVISQIVSRYGKLGLTAAVFILIFGVVFSLNASFLSSSLKQGVAQVGEAVVSVDIAGTSGGELLKPFTLSGAAFNAMIDDALYEFLYGPLF